jgi:enolase
MSKITKIEAREILDSRGNPTLEVDTYLDGMPANEFGRFSVPSGASTGKYEALEKRDGDPKRFEGKGVKELAERIEKEIAPLLFKKNFDQRSLDDFLIEKDGTKNKSNFGANSILGISMSFAKAESAKFVVPFYKYIADISESKPSLPIPMVNIINGGAHAHSGLDIQEFMIVPLWSKSFSQTIEDCDEVFMHLKKILEENGLGIEVGDEGGFAPQIGSHKRALDFMLQAIEKAGFKPDVDFGIALDIASSELYKNNKYLFKSENKEFKSSELPLYYENLMDNYPIISLEDPFAEDDWAGNVKFTEKYGDDIMIVGDDLFVTNIKKLEEGIEKKAANSILIKLNQVGTLSETLDVIQKAKYAGFATIISHRSGETEDTSVSHLAVGTDSGYIKTGSLSRGERTAKYNELLRIEEELNN